MRHILSSTAHLLTVVAVVWLSALAMRADAAGRSQTPAPLEAALPAGDGSDIARRHCLTCHGVDLIAQQRLNRDGWGREIDKMMAWGARVTTPERLVLPGYLATHFGVTGPQPMPNPAGADLLRMRCQGCHDRALIDQQRLTVDGWRREIDKMRAWGARMTEAEKAALAEYLAAR
jgi:cytochrome c5